jgi:hypothetical protein
MFLAIFVSLYPIRPCPYSIHYHYYAATDTFFAVVFSRHVSVGPASFMS